MFFKGNPERVAGRREDSSKKKKKKKWNGNGMFGKLKALRGLKSKTHLPPLRTGKNKEFLESADTGQRVSVH